MIQVKTTLNTQKRNHETIKTTHERHLQMPKEIKYLKKEEWLRLIESVDSYRDKLIIKLLYSTGMRVGELARLEIKDIDFQERFIHIPAENTKTKTARTVIVAKEVLSDIAAYLKIARIKQGKVFSLTVRRIQQLIKKYAAGAQINASPHTLRHTHIVHALLDRVPITAVQKQVGHKKLTTTQIYSNLAPEQVRQAYEGRGVVRCKEILRNGQEKVGLKQISPRTP